MAARTNAPAVSFPAPDINERVDVHVPRGASNDDPNLFISVNGKNFLLPRGKTSRVPRYIADEYYRSVAAQEALDKRMDAMIEASNTGK